MTVPDDALEAISRTQRRSFEDLIAVTVDHLEPMSLQLVRIYEHTMNDLQKQVDHLSGRVNQLEANLSASEKRVNELEEQLLKVKLSSTILYEPVVCLTGEELVAALEADGVFGAWAEDPDECS